MAAAAALGSVASAVITTADSPSSFEAAADVSLSLPRATTRAPDLIKDLAAEKPIPLVPPIITMTLPPRLIIDRLPPLSRQNLPDVFAGDYGVCEQVGWIRSSRSFFEC